MTREQDYNEYQRFQAYEASVQREATHEKPLAQEITNDVAVLALGAASVGTLIERPTPPNSHEYTPAVEISSVETRRAAGATALSEVMRSNDQQPQLHDRRTITGYAPETLAQL